MVWYGMVWYTRVKRPTRHSIGHERTDSLLTIMHETLRQLRCSAADPLASLQCALYFSLCLAFMSQTSALRARASSAHTALSATISQNPKSDTVPAKSRKSETDIGLSNFSLCQRCVHVNSMPRYEHGWTPALHDSYNYGLRLPLDCFKVSVT